MTLIAVLLTWCYKCFALFTYIKTLHRLETCDFIYGSCALYMRCCYIGAITPTNTPWVHILYYILCCSLQPCMHTFCAGCFSRWLKTSKECPACRKTATSVAQNHILRNLIEIYLKSHPGTKEPQTISSCLKLMRLMHQIF